jgi:hypothetical protein
VGCGVCGVCRGVCGVCRVVCGVSCRVRCGYLEHGHADLALAHLLGKLSGQRFLARVEPEVHTARTGLHQQLCGEGRERYVPQEHALDL